MSSNKKLYEHKVTKNKAVLVDGYYCSAWGLKHGVKHWCVGEAKKADLKSIPANYATKSIQVQADMIPDLIAFIDEARIELKKQGIKINLKIASGFRGFLNPHRKDEGAGVNVLSMAPSGFSQHHSGYAVDFDLVSSAKWKEKPFAEISVILDRLAPKYGFIRTFNSSTAGNPNNKFGNLILEPWHFCYVKGKNRYLLYNTI